MRAIHQIAHALGKVTVAEYVEDAETIDLLREIGIDYGQGFYWGKPTPEPQFKSDVSSENEAKSTQLVAEAKLTLN